MINRVLRFFPLRNFAGISIGAITNDELKRFAVMIGQELSDHFVASHWE
jgi:7-cyano-7-deazaguanine synthase in queuosine biosynthesis